ncbi:hypothetical protein ALQ15_116322 [Pseudomonas syringae pv. actinidiae]|uniref:Uncharacterized protein n=1 Tax=Pseudomonas syringae pv. actinidiae TaxID=103796 RepID=A0A7Z6U928_PSESF|nr:hypothetical protein ALQ15_116322 [Pseudomonas syringae pv. actinidiae]
MLRVAQPFKGSELRHWRAGGVSQRAAFLTHDFFGLVGAITGARSDFRVVAAGVRALVIDGAQAAFTVQIQAVVVAHALQREDFRLLVVTLDDAFFLQTFGDVLRRIAALELIDDADADQVLDLHFYRQRAATGYAAPTHVAGVFGPGVDAIEFCGGDQGGFHFRSGFRVYRGARSYRSAAICRNQKLPRRLSVRCGEAVGCSVHACRAQSVSRRGVSEGTQDLSLSSALNMLRMPRTAWRIRSWFSIRAKRT